MGSFGFSPQRQRKPLRSACIRRVELEAIWSVVVHHRTEDMTLDIIRILLAFLLPPLGVFLQVGLGLHFWLNILLTLMGWLPGIIHALWVILKK